MNEITIYLIIMVVIGVGIFILCREFFCWYFKITEVSNSLKKISESLSSSNTEDVKKIVKQVLHEEREYSLNNIYDEDGLIGHEWNQYVSDGHWMKSIFDEKSRTFLVKHYRTDKNVQENNGRDVRIKQEMEINSQQVYGEVDENKKNIKKHVPFMNKVNTNYGFKK